MPTQSPYSTEDRQLALDLYRKHGPAEASRLLRDDHNLIVRADTISQWAKRAGIVNTHVPDRAAYVLARKLTWAERRLHLAENMGEAAEEALVVLRDKLGRASAPQAAQVLSTLVDKTQLLTGGATDRIEASNIDDEIERLAAQLNEISEGDA